VSERNSNVITIQLRDPPSSPGLSLQALWKPYVYRGLGYDIYSPDEEDE
jgi:hypothetical protein